MTLSSAVWVTTKQEGLLHGWSDYDNDGWPDVYLAGLPISSTGLRRNLGGRFERVEACLDLTGMSIAVFPMWPDFDDDGWPDLFLHGQSVRLFRNLGNGCFSDVTESSGLLYEPGYNRPTWGDFDNDGFLDLLYVQGTSSEPVSVLYRNRGDGTFESVDIGSPMIDSASWRNQPSWGDYDNDGFLDLYQPNGRSTAERNYLYRNNRRHGDNSPNMNHWLKVNLKGRVSNRAGIGAKVRLQTSISGRTLSQLREISGTAAPAHFGLGDATNVTTLRIEWPSGIVQELSDVAADQHLTIVESQGNPPPVPAPAVAVANASANGLQLTIQEPASGARYALEASTDLANWAMLLARTSAGGTQSFTDTKTTNYPTRFYRVIVP